MYDRLLLFIVKQILRLGVCITISINSLKHRGGNGRSRVLSKIEKLAIWSIYST
jgi:hypothetical protein